MAGSDSQFKIMAGKARPPSPLGFSPETDPSARRSSTPGGVMNNTLRGSFAVSKADINLDGMDGKSGSGRLNGDAFVWDAIAAGRQSSPGGGSLRAVRQSSPGIPAVSTDGSVNSTSPLQDSRLSRSNSLFAKDTRTAEKGETQQSGKKSGRPTLQRSPHIARGTVVIEKVDAFATKIVESSAAGGAITLLVWLATIAYIVFLILQWKSTPPTKTVGTEWTIGFGPSPMKLTCMAKSGCLISNVASTANTLGVSDLVTPSQTVCSLLAYNTSISADVVFSVDPTEGLSVMWDPATANATSLVGGGLVIISEIRCPGDNDPACVFSLPTPISAGTALLQYVETFNDTAAGPAMHRREWFANMISPDGTVLHASTPCYDPSKPDPKLNGWVQGRLRMNSFYNTVTVTQDSFWLFLFGAVGGAYSLFLQFGAILLATIAFGVSMRQKYARRNSIVNEDPEDGGNDEDDDIFNPQAPQAQPYVPVGSRSLGRVLSKPVAARRSESLKVTF